jgi:serine/threonine-protein kinase
MLGGRYRVQDKIGIGGMATVYRGVDTVLGRVVAIKTMLPQYAADPSFAARFKQEAQAAAALQSPYIVGIFDWGKDGDTYYIVMEYLRGTDLKSGIRSHGALESRKVAQIGSQICAALSVAHKHDIIHRDIKPQNIMVQPDGNIKVMDFGIARAKNSHLTQDNSVLGTAHYVSPEQTQGKPLGPTSDLYSLGIVMYEAATGKVPFDGDDAITVALKQVNEQPVPPSSINPAVDPGLEAIIMKCLQKDPALRFQTAEELRRALTDYLAGRVVAIENGGATALISASPTRRIDRQNVSGGTQTMKRITPATQPGSHASKVNAYNNDDDDNDGKKSKKGLVIGILLALVVIGAALYFIFGSLGETREVPNYVSLTEDAAVEQIKASGFFEVGDIEEEWSDTVAEGNVISQDPASGKTATKGTKINLTVSKGEEPAAEVTVPDLSKMTATEAQAALSRVGLVAKEGDAIYSDVEEGRVAKQEPAANTTAKAGDTVTYYLSKGTENTSVPSVLGKSASDAEAAITAAGFVPVNGGKQASDSYDAGTVCAQTPSGGSSATKGSTVTYYISSGSESVEVPYVVGDDIDTARNEMKAAGLNVSTTYKESTQAGYNTVIAQSNTGMAKKGSTIELTVSAGPPAGSGSTSSSNTSTSTGEGTPSAASEE